MNESHISSQRLNLNPNPIHSSEGFLDSYKDNNNFLKLWDSQIKPIILSNPKYKGNSLDFLKKSDYNNFLKAKKSDKNLTSEKYIEVLKNKYTNIPQKTIAKDASNFERSLAKALVNCNVKSMPEIKTKAFKYLDNLRETAKKYPREITGSNEQILDHYLECKSEEDYIKSFQYKPSKSNGMIEYSVSISNWYNFEDDSGPLGEWDDVWPLINIIYKTWYPLACRSIKSLGGTNIQDNNGGYIAFLVRK